MALDRTLSPAKLPSEQRPPAEGWRAIYPFQSHWLELAGHRYHYLDEGQGLPLLCVHGNPTWSFHWRRIVAGLRDRYRVVAPDHLGCGLSDKPLGWTYRFVDHVRNLVALVEALDLQRVTLVAQDWGGAIGLAAAEALPQRFERLVLCNTGAFPPWFIPWRIRVCRWPLLRSWGVQGGNLFLAAALRMAIGGEPLSAVERAGYLAPYPRPRDRIAIRRFVEDIPLGSSHPTYAPLAELEAGLAPLGERPIQLIWGLRDWCFTPACLDRFLSHWPQAEVLRIPTAGHWVVEDAHQQVLECIADFVARPAERRGVDGLNRTLPEPSERGPG